jgi:hypothetical protein
MYASAFLLASKETEFTLKTALKKGPFILVCGTRNVLEKIELTCSGSIIFETEKFSFIGSAEN